ncbi:MAG: methyl-accepting chemotaxis protein [Clostridia bacterium]|nr:methyl-accepting chemotaxis protein [Clostridia bacterium]
MLERFKTVKNKILVGTIPVVIIAFTIVAAVVIESSRKIITTEINEKVENQVGLAKSEIVSKLDTHKKLPISLAKMVENMGIKENNKNGYIGLIKVISNANEETLGNGIFMADKYNGSYFCPYAYKTDDGIVYTEDYFADNTNEGWYIIGNTEKDVAWSEPYYDAASNITMITAASPIRNSKGKWIGIATGDLDFTNVQKIVSSIKVGSNGYAILLTSDGSYLSKGTEELKVNDDGSFKKIIDDENESLSKLGKEAIINLNGEGRFVDNNGKNIVKYSVIDETGWIVMLTIPEEEYVGAINKMRFDIFMITLISVAMLSALIVLISKNITKPLIPLKKDIEGISKGDFSKNIVVKSEDEIGEMAIAINKMSADLRGTIREILETSQNVAHTAEELEASANQNGLAVEQVATAATEISSSNSDIAKVTQNLDELIDYVSNLSKNIEGEMTNISTSINEVDGLSQRSESLVKVLIESMEKIFEDANDLSKVMTELREHSSQINTIVDTIQEISNQTNLLALNASIEAARAGEAGKGFAVVADEIRKLAEQSSESANNISNIISSVSEATQEANESTTSVVSSIIKGKEDLAEVKETFNNIITSVSEVNKLAVSADDLAKKIQINSTESNESAKKLSSLTDKSAEEAASIAAATEEQLASVEEQTSATTGLANMSEELANKVSQFKI